jgi:hypothetical protein
VGPAANRGAVHIPHRIHDQPAAGKAASEAPFAPNV